MYLEGGSGEGGGRPDLTFSCALPPPPHPCFGQMGKLREEKECSMSQVRELETSLAKLRTEMGKPGPGDPGAGLCRRW